MNKSDASSGEQFAPFATRNACKIFAFFEDEVTRVRTMKLCERLADQFGDSLFFEFSWLNCRRLEDAEVAARATDSAHRADVVMFCSHGNDLPPEAVRWLDSWVGSGKKRSKRAIALLYAEPFNTSAPPGLLRRRLETAATRLNMDFLPIAQPSAGIAGMQGEHPTPPSDGQVPINYHWGLNE